MDTSIHFSEVLGLLAVIAGVGAWVWLLAQQIQRRHTLRRTRLILQQYHRT